MTSNQSVGERPLPGRLTSRFSSLNASPARMARAATMLLRAMSLFLRSDGLGTFSPLPRAASMWRMAVTIAASSSGSRLHE